MQERSTSSVIVWRSIAACGAIAVISSFAGVRGSSLAPLAQEKREPRVIEVVAKRYAFEPATIEVAQGEPVTLLVRSADGPHGIAIKELRIDKEVDRGQEPVKITFTPKETGEFPILCTVICGEGHLDMKGKLVVVARPQEANK